MSYYNFDACFLHIPTVTILQSKRSISPHVWLTFNGSRLMVCVPLVFGSKVYHLCTVSIFICWTEGCKQPSNAEATTWVQCTALTDLSSKELLEAAMNLKSIVHYWFLVYYV